ncbi:unnamed protein product [Boreogadus saida]
MQAQHSCESSVRPLTPDPSSLHTTSEPPPGHLLRDRTQDATTSPGLCKSIKALCCGRPMATEEPGSLDGPPPSTEEPGSLDGPPPSTEEPGSLDGRPPSVDGGARLIGRPPSVDGGARLIGRPPSVDGGARLIGRPRGLPSCAAEALVHSGPKIILPPTRDLSRRCFHGDTNAGGSRVRCPVKQG